MSNVHWTWMMALAAPLSGAHAAPADDLVRLVNTYRSAPASCNGQRLPAVKALARHAALTGMRIAPGTILVAALERKGYDAAHVEAISIAGPADAASAFAAASASYCAALRAARLKAIGVTHAGNNWDIVLAEPAPPRPPPPPPLPPLPETARATVAAINQARAQPRSCGSARYPAAAPLMLSRELTQASLAHSTDMAANNYFAHESQDGARVSQRARSAGYAWLSIGENIAYGQRTVADVVDSWMTSPGHCANIMNAHFTEMGVGYALSPLTGRPYWTQVLGAPRR